MNKYSLIIQPLLILCLLFTSCSTYLQGVSPDGTVVYLGETPLENTQAYKLFLKSSQSERDKCLFLLRRVLKKTEYQFFRDGDVYTSGDAYDGGMWLLENRYEEGQTAREFMRDHIWRSTSGKPHYVRLSNGEMHIGYFLLLNDLDLLEETVSKNSSKKNSFIK